MKFQILKYECGEDILNRGGGFPSVIILHYCYPVALHISSIRLKVLFSNLKSNMCSLYQFLKIQI